jgi:CheY-like chemotaxis protein
VLLDVEVNDALERQGEQLRLASLCYVLGYAGEHMLAEALAEQTGWPAVVFDESVIDLGVLDGIDLEWARSARALPVLQDRRRVVVAIADPDAGHAVERELERRRGRPVELHVALDITLSRAIRQMFAARERGERQWVGPAVPADRVAPRLVTLAPGGASGEAIAAHRALFQEATRELVGYDDLVAAGRSGTNLPMVAGGSHSGPFPGVNEWQGGTTTTTNSMLNAISEVTMDGSSGGDDPSTSQLVAELDTRDGDVEDWSDVPTTMPVETPVRILVVDADVKTGGTIRRELERLAQVDVRTDGGDAIQFLRGSPPIDLVIADVSAPSIDGFRLCRVIKRSRRMHGVPVVLTASLMDAGPVSDDVLVSYGVDAFLEKPLDPRRLHRAVRELLGRRGRMSPGEPAFSDAMGRYQAGDLDGAIASLREGISLDPTSARHRFVLANLLQRKAMVAEAIDEYESVVELEPTYFPALTRLAYLYYRQGHLARAVETWRRSLPVCDDENLRKNIELFMRKLIADLQQPG